MVRGIPGQAVDALGSSGDGSREKKGDAGLFYFKYVCRIVLGHSLALTLFYHNFVRIHQSLRCTPAMRAGVSDHKWSIEEMVDLLPEVVCQSPRKKTSN